MADQTPQEHRTAEVYIDAPAETVYNVIADIPRMSEWDPELSSVSFIEGYRETAEGAKFQEQRQVGPVKRNWDCKVRSARRGEELSWDVIDGEWPIARRRFRMEPQGDGTRLQETMELFHVPTSSKVLWLLEGGQEGHMQKLEQSMNEMLEHIKAEVEQKEAAAVAS